MKKISYLLVFVQLVYSACDSRSDLIIEPPEIYSISPSKDGPGNTVTLEGNFDLLQGDRIVEFNGADAEILTQNDTLITVKVPDDASTGKITIKASGTTVVSNQDFEVLTGSWKQLQDFPIDNTQGTMFVIQGKIYVVGGFDGIGGTKTLWMYDPLANTWTQKANLPIEPDRGLSAAAVVVLNDIAYVAGGNQGGPDNKGVWKYDAASDEWTTLNDFPGEENPASIWGFVMDDKAYFVSTLKVYEYNVEDDSWTPKSDVPNGFYGQYFFMIGEDLYRIGRFSPEALNKKWNSVSNQWTIISEFTSSTLNLYFTGIGIGNKGYVLFSDNHKRTECWEYDPATDTWQQRNSNPLARWSAGATTYNGKAYVLGGLHGVLGHMNDFWEFTP